MEEMEVWAARDENGKLYLYKSKPNKDHVQWYSNDLSSTGYLCLPDEWLPEAKWTDTEPTKVIILIKEYYNHKCCN